MSYEDLKEHDIFLPKSAWGKADLTTTVNLPALCAVSLWGVGSLLAIWLGAGSATTWVGAVSFIGFMFAFAFVSNAGIERQNARIRRLEERTDEQ